MKIEDLAKMCLGGRYNTLSVERPINQETPNEVVYTGKFDSISLPEEIKQMEFMCFSVNGRERNIAADVVVYVE